MLDRRSLALLQELKRRGVARFSALKARVGNPRTLSGKLKLLLEHGLVEKREGVYFLTERGARVEALLGQAERELRLPEAIQVERVPHLLFRPVLRRFVQELREAWGDDLMGVLLFGSVARGDWTRDSDVDLLVVARAFREGRRAALRDLLAVRRRVWETEEYREAVRHGLYPTLEFHLLEAPEAGRFRPLYLDALTEGIVLFEREGFLSELRERFRRRLREMGARRVEIPGEGHYWQLGKVRAGEGVEL